MNLEENVEESSEGNEDLAKEIGATIKERVVKAGLTLVGIAGEIRSDLGFGATISAAGHLSAICSGYFYGHHQRWNKVSEGRYKAGLERLGKFLQYLDIDEKDQIIQRIREYDPQFRYPPVKRKVKPTREYYSEELQWRISSMIGSLSTPEKKKTHRFISGLIRERNQKAKQRNE